MTTADRIDFRPWAPPSAGEAVIDGEAYIGKHRGPGARALSLLRMLYRPRHRGR